MRAQSPGLQFTEAARDVLQFLHARLGFDLWMITRTEGEDWIVLEAEDHGYDVQQGVVFRWADSFCAEMVKGNGPQIASRSDEIPAYAAAPIGDQVTIGAYVGIPLHFENGELFGTMCAIHPSPRSNAIEREAPLIELMAGLLNRLLITELRLQAESRRAERAAAEALTDGLTDLFNRRGWDRLLQAEERRCQVFGHPAAVICLDIHGLKQVNDSQGHAAGDELIRRTARALSTSVRAQDVVARVGGDEFAVLGIECDQTQGQRLLDRIEQALVASGISVSMGMAVRTPSQGLHKAWDAADKRLIAAKHRHKESRDYQPAP